MEKDETAIPAGDESRLYPTDPKAQRAWLEDSIACRLADLKARVEGKRQCSGNL